MNKIYCIIILVYLPTFNMKCMHYQHMVLSSLKNSIQSLNEKQISERITCTKDTWTFTFQRSFSIAKTTQLIHLLNQINENNHISIQKKMRTLLREDKKSELPLIDVTNEVDGNTVLHFAARHNYVLLAQRAIELGINVNSINKQLHSALWIATFHRHIETAKVILKSPALSPRVRSFCLEYAQEDLNKQQKLVTFFQENKKS